MFQIIDNIISSVQDILNIFYKPYQLFKAKRLKLESIKIQICLMLNKLTESSAFEPADYFYLFMFDKFWLINKDNKSVLLSGGFNWRGLYIDSIDAKDSIHTKKVLEISESDISIITRIEARAKKGEIYEYIFKYMLKPSDKYSVPNCEVINKNESDLIYTDIILRCNAELDILTFSKNYYSAIELDAPEIGSILVSSDTISSVSNEIFRLYLEYLSNNKDVTFLFPEMNDDSDTDVNNDDLLQRVSLAKMIMI